MKPNKLIFSIGGFCGPGYSIEWLDQKLIYQSFPESLFVPDSKIVAIPTDKKWSNFKNKIDNIGVWDWSEKYEHTQICDGTQWDIEIDYGTQYIKSYGSNLYPGASEFDWGETPEFKALLHAMKLLTQ